MLNFITLRDHAYTLRQPSRVLLPGTIRRWSYDQLFRSRRLAEGSYIFCDIERLDGWELEAAAQLYQRIQHHDSPNLRAYNDPAKLRYRWALLRALNRAGINDFDAYRVDEMVQPTRFPVFVRREADHGPPLSDLLPDQAALDAKLDELQRRGIPGRNLVVIEYAAEPIAEGVFRKYGAFRIGDCVMATHYVHEDRWLVKYGKLELGTPERHREEYAYIVDNPHEAELRAAFEVAGIEYGRVDYGLVNGRIQIYEINTNPHIRYRMRHVPATRLANLRLTRAKLRQAFLDLDRGTPGADRGRLHGLGMPVRDWVKQVGQSVFACRPRD